MSQLELLRKELAKEKLDAYVVPSADAHNSEYAADYFKRRGYVTGFNGSAGTAVVTKDKALVFVDPRYWLEAEETVLPGWTVMREGDTVPVTPWSWLRDNLARKAWVGIDAQQVSVAGMEALSKTLQEGGIEVVTTDNLVDRIWTKHRPLLPEKGCWIHPLELAGCSVPTKLEIVRSEMRQKKCSAMVVSALDEVMWLFNIRGSDSVESPVLYSYAIVTLESATLYAWNMPRLTSEVLSTLKAEFVTVKDYKDFLKDLEGVASSPNALIWASKTSTNSMVWSTIAKLGELIGEENPIPLWKSVKNETEQSGMRDCHVSDATAVVRFLAWLETKANAGITEMDACAQLLEYRREEEGFVGPSFSTIMGSGANGAIIHYDPGNGEPKVISPDEMLLCDSGGHYLNGTTDITRTVHMGTPSTHEVRCYTRVLQGHVDLARAVIAPGTSGQQMDILARLPLYSDGLDYLHGTGHGVGALLNVHESPPAVGKRVTAHSKVPLQPGMIFSDEPGYYENGNFGIRIESLLMCIPAKTRHTFQYARYLAFENLSVVPFSRKLIDVSLLSEDQIRYIDSFHQRCFETVSPRLRNDALALEFLKRETRPLRKATAPLKPKGGKMSSLLAVASGAILGGVITYFAIQRTK